MRKSALIYQRSDDTKENKDNQLYTEAPSYTRK